MPALAAAPARLRWAWILDRRSDLGWYIGSAGVGWLYLALVLLLGRGLADPHRDPLFTLAGLPVTLDLLVVTSWGYLADAPHLFATLLRTFPDPAEWRARRGVLWRSWLWFGAGPAAVLSTAALAALLPAARGVAGLGGLAFSVFFQLWAYHHVARQHWGFLRLYQRKGGEEGDAAEARADRWFFHLALYLPLGLLLTAPWYAETDFPPLGLQAPILGGRSLAELLRPPLLALHAATLLGYAGYQARRLLRGEARNGPKLLFLASIVPLHALALGHPLAASFVLPIVTVGHNLQYQRIVWAYGAKRYAADPAQPARLRRAFRSKALYLALGLAFTLLCYHGPLVRQTMAQLAALLDRALLSGLAASAGLTDPERLSLGAQVVYWARLGWAMQHYYLDGRIWRVSRDAEVAKTLGV